MKVKVNDSFKTFEQDTKLEEILKSLNIQFEQGVAVAINEEVIPKSQWPEKKLQENDEILIIQATQGG